MLTRRALTLGAAVLPLVGIPPAIGRMEWND